MGHEYDYIVIGAGTAGCVLANRLSADGDAGGRGAGGGGDVLVLEAGGPDRHPRISTPGAQGVLITSKFDWGYWTEPQKQWWICRGWERTSRITFMQRS